MVLRQRSRWLCGAWLSGAHVAAGQLLTTGPGLPPECQEFATCTGTAAGADWDSFTRVLRLAVESEVSAPQSSMEALFSLMQAYLLDAGVALACRMGAASVFFRLGRQYLQMGFSQRAANLFQLAMSMFWDVSRAVNGMSCLQYELWGVRWFDDFMEVYLSHAARLQRNTLGMLPHAAHWRVNRDFRDPSLRIAVFSLCDYDTSSPMHWLLERSQRNRQAYCQRHSYGLEWTNRRPISSSGRHPVWGQIAGPLELLEATDRKYDWVLSMDCDSLFVDLGRTVDSLLYRFAGRETPWGKLELDPDVHFLISEDGRGLAGGNWLVRNSRQGRAFLREVYGPDDESQNPFMRHDLRDQFSLLWHLVRPGVSVPLPPEAPTAAGEHPGRPSTWPEVGYLPGVRLVPQELLLGSYPHVSCSQPGDRAHRCFSAAATSADDSGDFIVSVPLLGSLPQDMGQAMLDRFLLAGLGSLGQPAYEQQLYSLCADVDISRCLMRQQA